MMPNAFVDRLQWTQSSLCRGSELPRNYDTGITKLIRLSALRNNQFQDCSTGVRLSFATHDRSDHFVDWHLQGVMNQT